MNDVKQQEENKSFASLEVLLEKASAMELLVRNHEQLLFKLSPIITDLTIRLSALEKILINKKVFTKAEFDSVLTAEADKMNEIMERVVREKPAPASKT